MIFGRRSGPVKAVLAAVALVALSVLIVTFARLSHNLAAQAAINQESQRKRRGGGGGHRPADRPAGPAHAAH